MFFKTFYTSLLLIGNQLIHVVKATKFVSAKMYFIFYSWLFHTDTKTDN